MLMSHKSLTIWILNHYAGNHRHGMEFRHFLWSRHLKRLGHNPCIISASFHHLFSNPPVVKNSILFEEEDGIPFAFIKTNHYKGNTVKRLLNTLIWSAHAAFLGKRLEKRFGRPDVIIGSSPHPFVCLNLFLLKAIYHVPIVFEVRDLWPQMLIELGSLSPGHPMTRAFAWMERKAYQKCDKVISLWHSADTYMLQHGLTPERYIFLPNAIDLNAEGIGGRGLLSHPLILEVESMKQGGNFLIGYGGSHGYANPLECIFEACRLLKQRNVPDIDFVLVGDGPLKSDYMAAARAAGLTNIHFFDPVPKPVIMAFFSLMDANYMGLKNMPLFKYGPTPNKLMDYLAVGRPIIYSIDSSFNPVAECGAGISPPPDEPEKLVEAALELKSRSKDELRRMGRAGRGYAEKHLDMKVLAGRLAGILQDLVNDRPAG